jgi:peptide subunit release factor 1 (eRF1)
VNLSTGLGVGQTRCWLTDGKIFRLTKLCWKRDHLRALSALLELSKFPLGTPNPPVNAAMEAKAFAEFKELMITKAEMVTFGASYALCAADAGAVRSLILTEAVLQQQSAEKCIELLDPSHKFRGADVIIIRRGSQLWQAITEYGGAAAILRYAFDPAFCL